MLDIKGFILLKGSGCYKGKEGRAKGIRRGFVKKGLRAKWD